MITKNRVNKKYLGLLAALSMIVVRGSPSVNLVLETVRKIQREHEGREISYDDLSIVLLGLGLAKEAEGVKVELQEKDGKNLDLERMLEEALCSKDHHSPHTSAGSREVPGQTEKENWKLKVENQRLKDNSVAVLKAMAKLDKELAGVRVELEEKSTENLGFQVTVGYQAKKIDEQYETIASLRSDLAAALSKPSIDAETQTDDEIGISEASVPVEKPVAMKSDYRLLPSVGTWMMPRPYIQEGNEQVFESSEEPAVTSDSGLQPELIEEVSSSRSTGTTERRRGGLFLKIANLVAPITGLCSRATGRLSSSARDCLDGANAIGYRLLMPSSPIAVKDQPAAVVDHAQDNESVPELAEMPPVAAPTPTSSETQPLSIGQIEEPEVNHPEVSVPITKQEIAPETAASSSWDTPVRTTAINPTLLTSVPTVRKDSESIAESPKKFQGLASQEAEVREAARTEVELQEQRAENLKLIEENQQLRAAIAQRDATILRLTQSDLDKQPRPNWSVGLFVDNVTKKIAQLFTGDCNGFITDIFGLGSQKPEPKDKRLPS